MGKSLSRSLHDSDDDLIIVTPVPTDPGPSKPLLNVPKNSSRQASTLERPPPSIFKPNPLILITGFLRQITKMNRIPHAQFIYNLCCEYHSPKYESLMLDSPLIINNIDDQSYDGIIVGHDTSIKGQAPILKLSSTHNLKMDWNSSVQNVTNKNGTIILTVFGDLTMNKNSQISCCGNGNIYIQCDNLIMRTGAIISTTSIDDDNIYTTPNCTMDQKPNSKMHGNVYMGIRKSLIMDQMTTIKSGNIIIECSQLKVGIKASINALRGNLEIYAKNGIICDTSMDKVFHAKKRMQIHNLDAMNDDAEKIKETMRDSIAHKLTMFEEDSDAEFECCICWNREPNYMLKPCGHSTFCEICIDELKPTECPICRVPIVETKKF